MIEDVCGTSGAEESAEWSGAWVASTAFSLLFNSTRRHMFENHTLLDDDVPFTGAVRRVVITKMCENT